MVAAAAQDPQWSSVEVLMQYLKFDGRLVETPRLLPQCLASAERFLAKHVDRQWLPEPADPLGAPVAKVFRGRASKWRWAIPDLRACTGVVYNGHQLSEINPALGGFTSALAGYELDGPNTRADGLEEPAKVLRVHGSMYLTSYTVGGVHLEVTGHWGWLPIPADINDAVYRLAARIYHERAATYSDAVLLPEGGILQYFRQLPATVQAAVEGYGQPHIGLVGTG